MSITKAIHPNDQRAHCEQMFALRTHHVRFAVQSQVVGTMYGIQVGILSASFADDLVHNDRSRQREFLGVNEFEIRASRAFIL
jgi:hypothetical protein